MKVMTYKSKKGGSSLTFFCKFSHNIHLTYDLEPFEWRETSKKYIDITQLVLHEEEGLILKRVCCVKKRGSTKVCYNTQIAQIDFCSLNYLGTLEVLNEAKNKVLEIYFQTLALSSLGYDVRRKEIDYA